MRVHVHMCVCTHIPLVCTHVSKQSIPGRWFDPEKNLNNFYRKCTSNGNSHSISLVLAVTFNPDGSQLAVSSLAAQITIWDIRR